MFNKEAKTIIIEHCYSPVSRQCHDGAEGDNNVGAGAGTFCKVMFETDCRTIDNDNHQDDHHGDTAGVARRKSLPQTICKRLPKTLCGGSNCEFVQVSHNFVGNKIQKCNCNLPNCSTLKI